MLSLKKEIFFSAYGICIDYNSALSILVYDCPFILKVPKPMLVQVAAVDV